MKKFIVLLSGAMVLSSLTGCDYIRRIEFLDKCAATPSDEPFCKCAFKVADRQLSPAYGKTWIYRPDLGALPLFGPAMQQAERQCLNAYYPD
ncbi:MAG: hypothetical protein ACRCVQ_13620 [Acinetobacter ursingii]